MAANLREKRPPPVFYAAPRYNVREEGEGLEAKYTL